MPAMLVMFITVVVDGVVVWFALLPLLWATLIPGTLPLFMWLFVARPMLRQEQHKSDTDSSGP